MAKSPTNGSTAFVRAAAKGDQDSELLVVPGWREADWEALFGYAERVHVPRGRVLIRKHASERALYFVASGLLEVTAVIGSHSLGRIAKVHPGSVVGEPGLFNDGPRMANVEAMTPCVVWALRGPRLEELAQRLPALALELLRAAGNVMAVRMRANLSKQTPFT